MIIGIAFFWGGMSFANAKSTYHNDAADKQATIFLPGVISTNQYEINATFNKNGSSIIFSRCNLDFRACKLMESTYSKAGWSKPTMLPFSGEHFDADPYYDENYDYLYFISERPTKLGGPASKFYNLWRTKRNGAQWLSPEYLSELSSEVDELFPSITNSGDLYFPSYRHDKALLYVAKKNNESFHKPEAFPSGLFGDGGLVGDSIVLRSGKVIILSMRRKDSVGEDDLYISYLINGQWTEAVSLGDKVNTSGREFTPIVSPDGQYLFFTREENGVGNIYQIALKALPIKHGMM
jgi:hypothetical protein